MTYPSLRTLALTLPLLLAACGSVPTGGNGGSGGNGSDSKPQVSTSLPKNALLSPEVEVQLKVSDNNRVTRVQWVLDEGKAGARSGEFGEGQIKSNLSLSFNGLAGGQHTLKVTVTDSAGQTTTETYTFTVDAAAPRLATVALNGTAMAEGATTSLKVGAVATLVATATDNLSGATVYVLQGNQVIAQGNGSVTVDIAGSAAGNVNYKVVAVDAVGNTTVRSFTVTYEATTGETPVPSPILQINNKGEGPYSNILSVTVSAGVAAGVGVKQVILEVTDANGIVDTTSYVSSSENATFNIDTTKYPDGDLRLRAIAIDATGQRGVSTIRTVTVQNLVAPTLTFVAPSNGADVTGVSGVVLQLRQNNTDFTFTAPTENVVLEIIDSRGQLVTTQTATFTRVNEGLYQATTTVDFNATQYLNGTYTLRARTQVQLSGENAARTLTAESTVNNRSRIDEPPALNILLPAFYGDPVNPNLRPVLTRKSAVAVQVSDSDTIQRLQLQFTCEPEYKLPSQSCNTSAYNFNIPIGKAGLFYRVFNTGVLIDGQPFVENGNYKMRVTATDTAGNTNIKEMQVLIDRNQAGIANLQSMFTTVQDDGVSRLTPTAATWSISGSTVNDTRVIGLWYDRDAEGLATETPSLIGIDPQVRAGASFTNSILFAKAGAFRQSYLIQDLKTGVVEFYPGSTVEVGTRQKE